MLTDHEKTQLVNEYRRHPRSATALLLTCGAGLLVIIILALVGTDIYNHDNNRVLGAGTAQSR